MRGSSLGRASDQTPKRSTDVGSNPRCIKGCFSSHFFSSAPSLTLSPVYITCINISSLCAR